MELVTPPIQNLIYLINRTSITEGVGDPFEKIIDNLNDIYKSDKLLQRLIIKKSIKILKDDKLKLLSGLNVYVIFQKV